MHRIVRHVLATNRMLRWGESECRAASVALQLILNFWSFVRRFVLQN